MGMVSQMGQFPLFPSHVDGWLSLLFDCMLSSAHGVRKGYKAYSSPLNAVVLNFRAEGFCFHSNYQAILDMTESLNGS